MVVVKVNAPNEVNLILQIPLKDHVFREFLLEIVRDLLLYRFIGELRSLPDGTVTARLLASLSQIEASTSLPRTFRRFLPLS